MSLITLEQANWQLKIGDGSSSACPTDDEVLFKMALAEAIILDYLKIVAVSPPIWTDENNVPPVVQAAILLELGELWRFRGDDQSGQGPQNDGNLSPMIVGLLRRYRDPALA